ncbi:MAG: hypothetical protein MRJ65_07955 [Candidatus Brocadiaceae bacterium]|nr:hypothetical protein [Candidatus Brocadiaceae bacterium]
MPVKKKKTCKEKNKKNINPVTVSVKDKQTDNSARKTKNKSNIKKSAIIKASNFSSSRTITRNRATNDTMKMTFYVKKDLLEKLYNFAYWDRHNVTEAFNLVLRDGLKGKITKTIKRAKA